MRQIGHVTERHFIPHLIHARMKTFPVARELSAFRIEQSPARLSGDGIDLLGVRSAIVIEDYIRDQTQAVAVRRFDETQQFSPGPEPGWDTSLLVELAEVIIIVRVIAHRRPTQIRGFMPRWKPKRGESHVCQ